MRRQSVGNIRFGAVLTALFVIATVPALAASPELIGRGGAIAAANCGKCHAVGQTDASPQKITPPFRALGERYPVDMLVEAQKTGVVGGHDEMPMFDIGVDGVEALLAYIDSLAPAGPQYHPPSR